MEQQMFGGELQSGKPARAVFPAMRRGFLSRCPNCGEGKLFNGFLKVVDRCGNCGEDMHHHRADDLPAYLVVLILGHVVVGAVMGFTEVTTLSTWQILAIWIPMTIILALVMLRPIKGSIVGLQWALYMHGFGGSEDKIESHPEV